MPKKKRLQNNFKLEKNIQNKIDINDLDEYLYKNRNLVVDISFEGAFSSIEWSFNHKKI